MPRTPRREIVTIQGPTGMVAAAVRLNRGAKSKKPKRAPGWNHESWRFFDTIGEFRYACTWVGNILSRAKLVVYKDGKPTDEDLPVAALAALFGGPEGQREMLRLLGINLTAAGDAYIFGEDQGEDPDMWRVVAATQVSSMGDGDNMVWKIGNTPLDNPLAIRLWKPHPQKYSEPDAPARAVLPILGELEMLSKYVSAQGTSRLAGAGILGLPSEMSFGSVRTINGDDTDSQTITGGSADAFLIELMDTMMAAIEDQSDAAAKVPIILQGPGSAIEQIKHITFWTPFDENTKVLRDEAIRRLALGMDMPPEILTGSGDMNHWNAWAMEEASIKAHTEPLLQIITTGLSEKYLRPYLEDNDIDEDEARRYSIHADTSEIRLRPNRSKEAIELFEHGELSAKTMLVENGFDPEADIPTDEERKTWLTRKVAGGSVNPEIVAYALSLLGVPIPAGLIQVQERTTEERPTPTLEDHPTRDIPSEPDIAAAGVVVFRALERAGAKLRTKYPADLVAGGASMSNDRLYRYARIDEAMVPDLLGGAWECMDHLGLNIAPSKLDAYVRDLLLHGRTHTTSALTRFLAGS